MSFRAGCHLTVMTTTTDSSLRPTTPAYPDTTATRIRTETLLRCGALAGPAFLTIAAAQIVSRSGFDLSRHAVSALSLGDLGWIQIGNFIASGTLMIAGAAGMRRAVLSGRRTAWGPRLVGAHGASLIAAGVFVADAAYGFPAGAPAGKPTTFSWHGVAHGIAFGVGMLSILAACAVFTRHFATTRQKGWAAYSAATALAVPATLAIGPGGFGTRALTVQVVVYVWASMLSMRLLKPAPHLTGPNR